MDTGLKRTRDDLPGRSNLAEVPDSGSKSPVSSSDLRLEGSPPAQRIHSAD